MASTTCRICPEVIGYSRPFFREKNGALVHATCLYDELDKPGKDKK